MIKKIITLYHETLGGGEPIQTVQTASTNNIGTLTIIGTIVTLVLIFVLILYTAKKDLEKTNNKKK